MTRHMERLAFEQDMKERLQQAIVDADSEKDTIVIRATGDTINIACVYIHLYKLQSNNYNTTYDIHVFDSRDNEIVIADDVDDANVIIEYLPTILYFNQTDFEIYVVDRKY